MGKIPMFIPGTISQNGEVNRGPFVPENVPISATPLPKTDKATGFPPAPPITIKPSAEAVIPVLAKTEEDPVLKAIRERRRKEERGER